MRAKRPQRHLDPAWSETRPATRARRRGLRRDDRTTRPKPRFAASSPPKWSPRTRPLTRIRSLGPRDRFWGGGRRWGGRDQGRRRGRRRRDRDGGGDRGRRRRRAAAPPELGAPLGVVLGAERHMHDGPQLQGPPVRALRPPPTTPASPRARTPRRPAPRRARCSRPARRSRRCPGSRRRAAPRGWPTRPASSARARACAGC